MGYEEEEGEGTVGLEKPREQALGNGAPRRRRAEGPSEVHTPHSKRSKRVKEMIEERGGICENTFRAFSTQHTKKRQIRRAWK